MNNITILNVMPLVLSVKIMVFISAAFSLFYFLLAMIELLRIIYNHFRANYDWQKPVSHNKHLPHPLGHYHEAPSLKLVIWVIIYLLVTILLIIIFPINNI